MAIHECLGPSFHPFRASLNLEESIARNGPTTRSVLHPYVTLALERYYNPAQNPAAPYLYDNRSVSNADQKPKRKKKKGARSCYVWGEIALREEKMVPWHPCVL